MLLKDFDRNAWNSFILSDEKRKCFCMEKFRLEKEKLNSHKIISDPQSDLKIRNFLSGKYILKDKEREDKAERERERGRAREGEWEWNENRDEGKKLREREQRARERKRENVMYRERKREIDI